MSNETEVHWTEDSPDDYAHSVVSSAEAQADLPETDDLRSLLELIRDVRARGLKLALVVYNDGDASNRNGLVNGEIFAKCWERCGKPKDFFELEEKL